MHVWMDEDRVPYRIQLAANSTNKTKKTTLLWSEWMKIAIFLGQTENGNGKKGKRNSTTTTTTIIVIIYCLKQQRKKKNWSRIVVSWKAISFFSLFFWSERIWMKKKLLTTIIIIIIINFESNSRDSCKSSSTSTISTFTQFDFDICMASCLWAIYILLQNWIELNRMKMSQLFLCIKFEYFVVVCFG